MHLDVLLPAGGSRAHKKSHQQTSSLELNES